MLSNEVRIYARPREPLLSPALLSRNYVVYNSGYILARSWNAEAAFPYNSFVGSFASSWQKEAEEDPSHNLKTASRPRQYSQASGCIFVYKNAWKPANLAKEKLNLDVCSF